MQVDVQSNARRAHVEWIAVHVDCVGVVRFHFDAGGWRRMDRHARNFAVVGAKLEAVVGRVHDGDAAAKRGPTGHRLM